MSGNPNEYRKNALRCSDLARTAKTPELTTLLIGLSKTWTNMAREFERSQTLLEVYPPNSNKKA